MQIQGIRRGWPAVLALTIVALAASAGAGETRETGDAPRAFAPVVSLRSGFAASDGASGALLGASVRFGLLPRLTLELSADYLDRAGRGNAGGASGLASLLLALRPTSEKVVPFLAVGGGVFHRGAGLFLPQGREGGWVGGGPRDAGPRGALPYGPGSYDGRHRMAGRWDGSFGPEMGGSASAALSAGGGIRVDLGHNLSLMPDARALVVLRGGGTETIGVLDVSFGYRF